MLSLILSILETVSLKACSGQFEFIVCLSAMGEPLYEGHVKIHSKGLLKVVTHYRHNIGKTGQPLVLF